MLGASVRVVAERVKHEFDFDFEINNLISSFFFPGTLGKHGKLGTALLQYLAEELHANFHVSIWCFSLSTIFCECIIFYY